MTFWNGASGGATASPPAATENTSRTMVAVARNSINVVSNGSSSFGDSIDTEAEGIHGEMSVGFVGVLIVGLVLFYIWTRNVQGGG